MKMLSTQNPFQKHPVWLSLGLNFLLVLIILLLLLGKGSAGEKMTIGEAEDVILMPWGVRLPARIDTGAATSSLDARELTVKNNIAEFRLPKMYGGLRLRLPVIEWQKIRSADFRERRPVVELEICLGSNRIRTLVNLADRSMVKYPLILGRNFLKENYVVDVKRRRTLKPNCSDDP